MQQNIKNAEEQQQRPFPQLTCHQSSTHHQSHIHPNPYRFNYPKLHYISLLFLLLQIIMSAVIFILLMTLNYVGFGRVNQSSGADKIFFDNKNCENRYLIEVGKFISVRLKSAFVFLCVEMIVSFMNGMVGFEWAMKVLKECSQQKNSEGIYQLRKICRILSILICSCIILITLMFGTYMHLIMIDSQATFNKSCQFTVINQEVISIAYLLGVKLLLYLVIWLIVMCVTYEVNRFIEHNKSIEGIGLRLPYLKQLQSILAGGQGIDRIAGLERENNQNGLKKRYKNTGLASSEEEQFKQLKTEDFLLELKNNSKNKEIFQDVDNFKKFKIQEQYVETEQQQDQNSNRRMMIYRLLQSQKYQFDKNLPKPIPPKNQPKKFKRQQSRESYSVNNSLQKQKYQNNQLLINSIQRTKKNDRFGTLPLSSKKKPLKEIENSFKYQKMMIKLDKTRQNPHEIAYIQQKWLEQKQLQKPESRSIIMPLQTMSERSRKQLNKIKNTQNNSIC